MRLTEYIAEAVSGGKAEYGLEISSGDTMKDIERWLDKHGYKSTSVRNFPIDKTLFQNMIELGEKYYAIDDDTASWDYHHKLAKKSMTIYNGKDFIAQLWFSENGKLILDYTVATVGARFTGYRVYWWGQHFEDKAIASIEQNIV